MRRHPFIGFSIVLQVFGLTPALLWTAACATAIGTALSGEMFFGCRRRKLYFLTSIAGFCFAVLLAAIYFFGKTRADLLVDELVSLAALQASTNTDAVSALDAQLLELIRHLIPTLAVGLVVGMLGFALLVDPFIGGTADIEILIPDIAAMPPENLRVRAFPVGVWNDSGTRMASAGFDESGRALTQVTFAGLSMETRLRLEILDDSRHGSVLARQSVYVSPFARHRLWPLRIQLDEVNSTKELPCENFCLDTRVFCRDLFRINTRPRGGGNLDAVSNPQPQKWRNSL